MMNIQKQSKNKMFMIIEKYVKIACAYLDKQQHWEKLEFSVPLWHLHKQEHLGSAIDFFYNNTFAFFFINIIASWFPTIPINTPNKQDTVPTTTTTG